jgi:hypothetical protein
VDQVDACSSRLVSGYQFPGTTGFMQGRAGEIFGKKRAKLLVWQGRVKGALRREQIYDDVG